MKFMVKFTRLRWKVDGGDYVKDNGTLGPFSAREIAEKAVIALVEHQSGVVVDGEVQSPVFLLDAVIVGC